MAYTLDKEWVCVKDAILWIAEHAYPDEFQENRRKPIKRVRQRIQDAFFLRKNLPGSESIEPTRTKALPNDGLLKAPQFFIWAAEMWPVLREQEGIIPLLGTYGNASLVMPMPTLNAFSVSTPKDLAELQKQHIAAEDKAFHLQQELNVCRAENESLRKQIEESEKKKAALSKTRSMASAQRRSVKKKQPGQPQS